MTQMRWLELLSTVRIGSKSRALNWHAARFIKIMTVLFFAKLPAVKPQNPGASFNSARWYSYAPDAFTGSLMYWPLARDAGRREN